MLQLSGSKFVYKDFVFTSGGKSVLHFEQENSVS